MRLRLVQTSSSAMVVGSTCLTRPHAVCLPPACVPLGGVVCRQPRLPQHHAGAAEQWTVGTSASCTAADGRYLSTIQSSGR